MLALCQISEVIGYKNLKKGAEAVHKQLITFPKSSNELSVERMIKNSRSEDDQCPSEGIDLLFQLLNADPFNRITAKESLNHPFFRDIEKEYIL